MNKFFASFWAESLKVRRSLVTLITAGGLMLLPIISGLFMIIMKDPENAKNLGLISTKAQLVGGVADWPSHFGLLNAGIAIAGFILFSIITAWVFGREFADRTVKELLALPTPRSVIVVSKFVIIGLWVLLLSLLIFAAGLIAGWLVDIPGWSSTLLWSSFGTYMLIVCLTYMLLPVVAFIASIGRGYLSPLGWTFLAMALAQIAGVLGWGEWFPWTVPGLLSALTGTPVEALGIHSYVVVFLTFAAGLLATIIWWRSADQAK
jgi:ABC-2 type transport system permease protein